MRFVNKAFALGMVLFWTVMSSHCALELLPSFSFLACAEDEANSGHSGSDCGNKEDACASVESGSYRSEESAVIASGDFSANIFLPATVPGNCDLLPAIDSGGRDLAPPELFTTWRFSCRTALSPRAPTTLA